MMDIEQVEQAAKQIRNSLCKCWPEFVKCPYVLQDIKTFLDSMPRSDCFYLLKLDGDDILEHLLGDPIMETIFRHYRDWKIIQTMLNDRAASKANFKAIHGNSAWTWAESA